MPRQNKHRTLGSERTLAERVLHERTSREWTYEMLARRMTEVGCSIQPSALYKVEKGSPPRRVTVDELVALSNVFGVPMEELLIPVALMRDRVARRLVSSWVDTREQLGEATANHQAAMEALVKHLREHPETQEAVEVALADWARDMGWDAEEAAEYWSLKFRDASDEDIQAFADRWRGRA